MSNKDLAKRIEKIKESSSRLNSESKKKELKKFLETSKMFDDMVDKGLIEKRGYNLMTIDNIRSVGIEAYVIK